MEVSALAGAAERPRISQYKDYRIFLEHFYQYKKSLRSGFSYRQFSSLVGVKSPNYLQLVIQAKRNLSDRMSLAVAKALRLEPDESRYFQAMVALENAPNVETRGRMQAELLRLTRSLVSKQIPHTQSSILLKWYHLLIRELVLLPDFEPSGSWISVRLRGLMTAAEAEDSFDLLVKMGFLRFEKGRYQQADPVIDTGDAFGELQVTKVHQGTLAAWSKILPSLDRDQREIGLINIPISKEKIPEFKVRIRKFQDEIIGWLESETQADQVVQLGTYLIPITTIGESNLT